MTTTNNQLPISALDLSNPDGELEHCHLMPCKIDYNGTSVNAQEYFWPTIQELVNAEDKIPSDITSSNAKQNYKNQNKDSTLTASFRGRPLQGKRVDIPEGYKGVVLMGNTNKNGKKENNVKSFKEFYYWNWDQIPSEDDKVMKALQWIQLSKAINGDSSVLS